MKDSYCVQYDKNNFHILTGDRKYFRNIENAKKWSEKWVDENINVKIEKKGCYFSSVIVGKEWSNSFPDKPYLKGEILVVTFIQKSWFMLDGKMFHTDSLEKEPFVVINKLEFEDDITKRH